MKKLKKLDLGKKMSKSEDLDVLTVEKVAENICKSMYKAMAKYMSQKSKSKKITNKIIDDILDPNYTAQVDPDEIPPNEKQSVVWKSKDAKLKGKRRKGVKKLKKFLDNRHTIGIA